jgi:hypothetical protein
MQEREKMIVEFWPLKVAFITAFITWMIAKQKYKKSSFHEIERIVRLP